MGHSSATQVGGERRVEENQEHNIQCMRAVIAPRIFQGMKKYKAQMEEQRVAFQPPT